MRWLHTYVSMLGLGALLFFALTGLTLNHPEWTLGTHRSEKRTKGQLDVTWIQPTTGEKSVDRLAVTEYFRRTHGVTGLVDEFRVEAAECSVAFKGPAYSADVVIDRQSGRYDLIVAREGWVALVNDLHKGRHTGTVWAWLIDLAAAMLSLVAVTGIWLLLYVRKRRQSGLWAGLVGVLIIGVIYLWQVR